MNRRSYSQNNEQDVILEFFSGIPGMFLDIGAFDGVEFSNTRALAELGWSGIMVEPNPYSVCRLIDSVKQFDKRVDVWSCAVSGDGKPAQLKMTTRKGKLWASTISRDMPDDYVPDQVEVNLHVPSVRIGDLLQYGPFRFINIDAEWMDFEILKDSPPGLGACELVCIEPRDMEERKLMIKYLSLSLGFEVHHETNENIIARKK